MTTAGLGHYVDTFSRKRTHMSAQNHALSIHEHQDDNSICFCAGIKFHPPNKLPTITTAPGQRRVGGWKNEPTKERIHSDTLYLFKILQKLEVNPKQLAGFE